MTKVKSILTQYVPKDWSIKKIKYVFNERKEINYPQKTDVLISLTHHRGVIPYSEKGDIGNKEKDDLTKYKLVYPGDLVVNSMNVIIGSSGLSKYYGLVSPVYYMLIKKDESYDNKFFHYLFRSIVFQKNLIGVGNGILEYRMRIPMDKLGNCKIPLPPSNEQSLISKFLDKKIDTIDGLINKFKNKINILNQQKLTFTFESITKGLDLKINLKDSNSDWFNKIPSNWKVKKLKYIFDIKKNIAGELGHNVISITQKGCKIKDIESGEGQMSMDYSKYQLVKKGDFLMNHMDLLTGYMDVSLFDGVTSPDYRVFEIKDKLCSSKYFLYLLQFCYHNKIFYKYGRGSSLMGRWRFPTIEFENFYVPVPPLEDQINISKFLETKIKNTDLLTKKILKKINLLQEYRETMISSIVTGKKRLN